jgi:NDP-sugar pyrophosphorylase family protein
MIDIQGEPFIGWQLKLLRRSGFSHVVICAGYEGKTIQDYVRDGAVFDLNVEFSLEEGELLGTAGAIKKALPLLGETFFVVYGDAYLPCDYCAVQEAFISSSKPALMAVYRNEDRWDRSNVEFRAGRIHAYDKEHPSPQMKHIDYGLGVFERRAFDRVPDDTPYDLSRLYQELIEENLLAAHQVDVRFFEIGSFEGLEEFRRHLASKENHHGRS